MKIALNSYSGYGAWFALRLLSEGHEVDYFLSKPEYGPVLQGIVPKPKLLSLDHRQSPLNYASSMPDYSKYELSLFDLTGRKRQADYSHSLTPTIGDGSFHCVLEDDRATGIQLMEAAGISVPPYEEFTDLGAAKAHVKKTGKRFVFKPDGGQDQDTATTYVSKNAEDMLEYLDKVYSMSHGAKFILQEFIEGIEISVEGWFNGSDFYLLNCTLEEKKFMNENIGPNTGCSGNLVFTLGSGAKIYRRGLEKMKSLLGGIGFRGMIDLNTIVTPQDCYGLEWTPRFGYDASATLISMYAGDYGKMLHAIASGGTPEQSWKAEFGTAVRLSIPPYPTEMKVPKKQGIPVKGLDLNNKDSILNTYLYDVQLAGDKIVTSGINGLIAVPLETGSSIAEAFGKLEDKVKQFQIPDMQYRTDLQKSTRKRYAELDRLGWLS
jgi:phosphoribosylamine---glycine ligase